MAARSGSRMYVFGGYDGVSWRTDTAALNLDTHAWEPLRPAPGAPMPGARASGSFTLSWRNYQAVVQDASSADQLALALRQLPFLGDVRVAIGGGRARICPASPGSATTTYIDFLSHGGDLPPLAVVSLGDAARVAVHEVRKGVAQRAVGRRRFSALAQGLSSTRPYFVRAAAYNRIGHGPWAFATVERSAEGRHGHDGAGCRW